MAYRELDRDACQKSMTCQDPIETVLFYNNYINNGWSQSTNGI